VEYALRAGDRARELLAWDDAAQNWEGAVLLLELDDAQPEVRVRLLIGLADLMTVVGDVGRQIGYLERALALCERTGDAERGAHVHSRLGIAHCLLDSIYAEYMDLHEAFRHFDAAREVLDKGEVRKARGHLDVGLLRLAPDRLRSAGGRARDHRPG
jgi:hypothetical protein